jgi:flagellin
VTVGFDNLVTVSALQHLSASFDRLRRVTNQLVTSTLTTNTPAVALSTRVDADIAAINQQISNTGIEISMYQTAESAVGGITECLRRMRQLGDQAFSGIYNAKQVRTMNEEYQQLAEQITATLGNTEFNGISLLSGDDALVSLDLSAVMDVDLTDLSDDALSDISTAITDTSLEQVSLGAHMNRLDTTISALQAQAEGLQAFQSRVNSTDTALAIVAALQVRMQAMMSVAVAAQANIPVDWVQDLLRPESS